MGLQGALVAAFRIPTVFSVALTGTELLLGIRLARGIDRQADGRQGKASSPFLITTVLCYVLAALVVGLATSWIGRPFIPFLLVTAAILVVLKAPERQSPRASKCQD